VRGVLDPETVAFLESGCALIVGTVARDGTPYATRGWGMTITDRVASLAVRLLLDAADAVTIGHLADGGRIAVTATSVPTLKSRQLKGTARSVAPATDADRDRAAQYCEQFYGDICRTEHTLRALPERLTPADYVACTIEIDELFDQTPGPGAGAALGATP
jgi:Pyridoxamine 5'-phosphate oxidase